jgi:hypothetical protein
MGVKTRDPPLNTNIENSILVINNYSQFNNLPNGSITIILGTVVPL